MKKLLTWVGIGAGLFIAYPLVVRYMRSSEARDKISEQNSIRKELEALAKDPVAQSHASDEIIGNHPDGDIIQSVASNLPALFGLKPVWWDITTWFPKPESAYFQIGRVTDYYNGQVPDELIADYALKSANSNSLNGNLQEDCQKYLNNEDFNKLIF